MYTHWCTNRINKDILPAYSMAYDNFPGIPANIFEAAHSIYNSRDIDCYSFPTPCISLHLTHNRNSPISHEGTCSQEDQLHTVTSHLLKYKRRECRYIRDVLCLLTVSRNSSHSHWYKYNQYHLRLCHTPTYFSWNIQRMNINTSIIIYAPSDY